MADLLLTGPVDYSGTAAESEPLPFPGLAESEARARCRVELVVAGRVPGYAGPWLSQYTYSQSQSQRPLALVRFGQGGTELETYGKPIVPASGGATPDLDATLRAIVTRGEAVALAPADVPTAELCRRAADVERWTILTGADDQSVVACYQVLKLLLTQGEGIGPTAGVGLVFVGCDEPMAKAGLERLKTAAERHLGLHVDLAGILRKIEPITGRSFTRFSQPDPWPALSQAIGDSEPAPGHQAQELLSREELDALHAPEPAQAVTEREPEPLPPAPATVTGLAVHVPGLKQLRAACPRQPDVELAVDGKGRLHVLLRVTGGQSGESAIVRLLDARLWAIEHRELLALTCRGEALDTAEPVAHLFTDRPAAVAPLAFAGPAEARPFVLHLLKQVHVAGQPHLVHEVLS